MSTEKGGRTVPTEEWLARMQESEAVELEADEEAEQERESHYDWLFECFYEKLYDLAGKFYYDVPESSWEILREYDSRNASLGEYHKFMPYPIAHVHVLRMCGTPDQLRGDIEAIECMEPRALLLTSRVTREDVYAFDNLWRRLNALLMRSEHAEQELAARGFRLDKRLRLVLKTGGRGQPARLLSAMVQDLYRHMKPRYELAWPEDVTAHSGRNRGKPKGNPKRLQGHIQTLLAPYLGRIGLARIRDAINNLNLF